MVIRTRHVVSSIIAAVLFSGCASSFQIHDRPISFSTIRYDATLAYIKLHYGLDAASITIEPKIIVLHWTAIPDAEQSYATFHSENLGTTRPDLTAAGNVNVSAHFLVDRDGTAYRLMPETWMARHTIGINYSSIGIENVGGAGSVDDLTNEQIKANVNLVRYLKAKYPTIEYLIGHYEYTMFEDHPLWLEKDDEYRTEKVDPGDRFMSAVRRDVADLGLLGTPGLSE